tara:strand:+ start:1094 stop:1402 length:309 start_codon:yes stop_codon:yes gene_type:complete
MLKVSKKNKPEKILLGDEIYILWEDGHESRISFFDLRDACPCASCVDELSGEKTLDTNSIPPDITPLSSEYVGNYALRIYWSDKHDTGIFHFKMLRNFRKIN